METLQKVKRLAYMKTVSSQSVCGVRNNNTILFGLNFFMCICVGTCCVCDEGYSKVIINIYILFLFSLIINRNVKAST